MFVEIGHQYALDVVSGKRLASSYAIGSCQRYLDDLDMAEFGDYCFDAEAAEKYLRLVQKFHHVKGTWDNPEIIYEPWQHFIFMNIMGWKVRATGHRRFRTAHVEVPRGNGKAHPIDEVVPTPTGLKKWGGIEIGSELLDRHGGICRVVGKTPTTMQEVWRVTFSDGSVVETSGEHEWISGGAVVETRQLSSGSIVCDCYLVESVERTGTYKPMFCVEVDSIDNQYLISSSYIPTHNSLMASQAALYFLALDNPVGNTISCCATKRDQARIVLDSARAMAQKCIPFLKHTGVEVLAHTIKHDASNSEVVALSSDYSSLDGRADVLSICDELHAMNRKTFETIESGMSKRRDSLLLCITTAGYDIDGIGSSQSSYAKRVALGTIQDDTFFSMVHCADDSDDPLSPATWEKANPNWTVSVDEVNLAAKAKKAAENAYDLANFRIKHLNQWIGEAKRYFSMDLWDTIADPSITMERFKGKQPVVGLDLAAKFDLTGHVSLFKEGEHYYIVDRAYIPQETFDKASNDVYSEAAKEGNLIVQEGKIIHYQSLRDSFLSLHSQCRPSAVMFDPWNALEFGQHVLDAGYNAVEFRMNVGNMSEAMKKVEALIREGKIHHSGSTILKYCMGNVVAQEDKNGNVFPRKSHELLKIDLAVALIMALGGMLNLEPPKTSVYEIRGIRTI